jgi:hypothetical protein
MRCCTVMAEKEGVGFGDWKSMGISKPYQQGAYRSHTFSSVVQRACESQRGLRRQLSWEQDVTTTPDDQDEICSTSKASIEQVENLRPSP